MSSVLTQLAPILAGPSRVEDVIAQLTAWATNASGCQRARLFRMDRARHELHCRMANGDSYELRLPAGRGIHGQAMQSQLPQTGRSPESGDALLVVPVVSPPANPGGVSEVIAALEFADSTFDQRFQPEDEDRLKSIATEVGRVLAHAGLDDSRRAPERITEMVGNSAAMLTLYDRICEVADNGSPVLLAGAHGTGKTLVARVIHHLGPRRRRAFVSLRCHAEPVFLDAELFGVPGAEAQLPGAIRRSEGGTLYVQQFSNLSATSQERLLQMASQYQVRLIVMRRITSAANGNRQAPPSFPAPFSAQSLKVPTLAERGPDDIASLARYFIRESACQLQVPGLSIDDEALTRLRSQHWPGNVKELAKCIERAVLTCDGTSIGANDLCLPGETTGATLADSIPSGLLLADAEKRYILRTLAENQENRTRTASSLGIGRNTLVRKIKQYRNK